MNWFESEKINWRPPEDLKISEWSERKVSLTGHSEEKGPLRLRRTPYMIPIMDAFLNPDTETVVVCKSAQIAGTTGMLCVIGYYAEQEACPIMLCMSDENTAVYMNRERLRPMFRDSVELSYLYDERKFGKDENILTNSSYIAMAWASSVSKIASRPMRIVVADEIDKPGYYLTTREASPLSLLIDRTETFYNRKIGILSTPTIEQGNITIELESCDLVFDFHVPCPYCGIFQPLRWSREHSWGFDKGFYRDEKGKFRELGQVHWEGGLNASEEQIEAAGYECGSCKKLWTTLEKNQAVEQGKMVARTGIDRTPKKVGFHINRIYSLLGNSGNLPKLVNDWIEAQETQKKLQGFINSTLAEPWKHIIITINEEKILAAKTDLPAQTVPEDSIGLTAGIDPQKFGFWFCVRAWAENYCSWLIHYGFLSSWDEIATLLFETSYPVRGNPNQKMKIIRAAIDSGGGGGEFDRDPSMTEEAYWWIRENGFGRGCFVWATKGSSRPLASKIALGKFIDRLPSGKPLAGGIQLIMLDTDQLKDSYHYRIGQALEGGNRAAYLNREVGSDYASQILAERKELDESGRQIWKRIKKDNHYLDCDCLAMACADPEWSGGGIHLLKKLIDQEESRQRSIAAKRSARGSKFQRPDMAKIREKIRR